LVVRSYIFFGIVSPGVFQNCRGFTTGQIEWSPLRGYNSEESRSFLLSAKRISMQKTVCRSGLRCRFRQRTVFKPNRSIACL